MNCATTNAFLLEKNIMNTNVRGAMNCASDIQNVGHLRNNILFIRIGIIPNNPGNPIILRILVQKEEMPHIKSD